MTKHPGVHVASVGAAVLHPSAGRCLTTAGHLFAGGIGPGRQATIVGNGVRVPGTVIAFQNRATIDYALVAPPPGFDSENVFSGSFRIGPVFNATAADRGTQLFLIDRLGVVTRTTCRGVGGGFDTAAGTFVQTIQTDPIGQPGQSGGALVDEAQRLWGFLLGTLGDQFSIFAPAQLILDAAGVQLIQ